MPVVYAYRDVRAKVGGATRWKPRVVMCTPDEEHRNPPGDEYVVKYGQGAAGFAALISEVISHAVLQSGGLHHLDAALVRVSGCLSKSYEGTGWEYIVEPGCHFGTVHRLDVFPAPPQSYEEPAAPTELVDIWVFDTWLMNIDRTIYGNLLMFHASSSPVWSLLAADQSDCFCGAAEFQSGRYIGEAGNRGAAGTFGELLDRTLLEHGAQAIREAIDRVTTATMSLDTAFDRVPEDWWAKAQVDRLELKDCMLGRARRLPEIVKLQEWEGLADDINGGQLLDV